MDLFSPPAQEESPPSSSLVSDNDTTINLAQIERVNSMSMTTSDADGKTKEFGLIGQQVDDEILVQMMVNDEISDSQGIENDSILAGQCFLLFVLLHLPFDLISADVKQCDDEELLDDDV